MDGGPVRIALVGAGRMGRVHLAAVRRSSVIEPAGVVEPAAAVRETLAADGLEVHENVDRLLDRGGVEGVLIAVPSDQHRDTVQTFAAAGIPILCEKPLGIAPGDAGEAARAADDAGVLLQVGYWRRFLPELRTLRRRIASGELGVINQLACMQWDAEPPSEQFRDHSGGIAIDMGVHEFDQARWLLGQEFDWVVAASAGRTGNDRWPASDPDAATILGRLSGDATVTISLGRRFPQPDSCWVEVWGTGGYDRIQFMWGDDGQRVFADGMLAQAEAFARAVRGEPREGAGGADALAAITVAERVARSLAVGGERVVVGAAA